MTPYQTVPPKARNVSGSSAPPLCGGVEDRAFLGITANKPSIRSQSGFTGRQRYERYALQSAARSALTTERVGKCLRVPTSNTVDIHKTVATGTFHYQNLQTCGSVWHCPCCAAKISEKRKVEVQAAIAGHEANGGRVYLLTLTLPHHINQSLKRVLKTLLAAHTAFRQARAYREGFKVQNCLVGEIRSLEVTYGANGWHPHLHLLLFSNEIAELKHVEHELLTIWQKVVVARGFDEPNHHGLTLENGERAAQYVGKWGLEHEMTKGHIKRSREGFTPFDLLRVIVGTYAGTGQNVDAFDAVNLFREYGQTFKGRRQLVWSKGLRQRFALGEEKTDEELADQVDEQTALFAQIPLATWRVILSHDKRGEVLAACEKGMDAFYDLLIELSEGDGTYDNSCHDEKKVATDHMNKTAKSMAKRSRELLS